MQYPITLKGPAAIAEALKNDRNLYLGQRRIEPEDAEGNPDVVCRIYPETYALVREERSGEETVLPLGPEDSIDAEEIAEKWAESQGCTVSDTGPSGLADYSCTVYTDGREPGAVCWDSCGFWLEVAD